MAPFGEFPDVQSCNGGARRVLRAMRYRWSDMPALNGPAQYPSVIAPYGAEVGYWEGITSARHRRGIDRLTNTREQARAGGQATAAS